MAYKTMVSLGELDLGEHTIDRIAVSSAYDHGIDELGVFSDLFDCWIESDRNVLASSWNRGIDLAFERGNDYALVINLDLAFHPKFLMNIIQGAQNYPDAIVWSGSSWPEEATLLNAP